jgi:Ca-activated chloride channel family protein
MSFTFAYPWLLLALLLLPLLAWLKGKFNRKPAFLYSSIGLVRSVARQSGNKAGAILKSLRWIALACFIIALSRPRLVEGTRQIQASGIDIVICLDLSTSMMSEDFKDDDGKRINRLELAKKVIEEFVEKRTSDRIGLVAFAGEAYLVAPLTLDHDFFQTNLERLGFENIVDGTSIGSGLVAAVNRLREVKSKSKIVVLMTDGQNTGGEVTPISAANASEALGIKVYTIGVGTRGLAPYPAAVNRMGQKVYKQMQVNIDEDTLKEIAERTAGKYFRADSTDTLRKVYDEIDELEKTKVVIKKSQQIEELLHWPILAGLFLLLVEIVLTNTLFRRIP